MIDIYRRSVILTRMNHIYKVISFGTEVTMERVNDEGYFDAMKYAQQCKRLGFTYTILRNGNIVEIG